MAHPATRPTSAFFTPQWAARQHWLIVLLIVAGAVIAIGASAAIGLTDKGTWIAGGVFAVFAALIISLRPEFGLYLLVAFVYANVSDLLEVNFGIPSTNKFLVALIFVGTLSSRIVLHHKPLIFRGTEIVILAYGSAVLISVMGAAGSSTIGTAINWFKDFAILFIIVQMATEEQVWKRMQWILILVAGLLSLLSIYQVLTGNYEHTFWGLANAPVHEITVGFDSHRVTGPIEDPNYYGMILLMILPMAVYRLFTERDPLPRLVGGVASFLIAATVIFTYSRGAFLAALVIAVLIARERRVSVTKFVLAGAVLVLIFWPLLPAGFTDRVLTLGGILPGDLTMQTESSFRGRSSEAIIAVQMFREHPLTGVGHGNYARLYLGYSARLGLDDRLEARQAHSLYLELIAETGLVGASIFAVMLIVLFRELRRAKRVLVEIARPDLAAWVTGIQYGLVAYLLASIFLHSDYARYMWLMIGFAASASALADAQRLYRLANVRLKLNHFLTLETGETTS